MASRDLNDLHPLLRPKAKSFLQLCKMDGIDVLIYCTYRSSEEQNELYAKGRTKPGRIVTNAKGGQSAHNHTENGKPAALAFDAVPTRKVNGHTECLWSAPKLYARMGQIAEEVGLKWGGNWHKFQDKPHFYIKLKEANNA